MQPYLSTLRGLRWLLLAIVAVVWGAGLVAAAYEYQGTYEAEATVWAVRPSTEFSAGADDPNVTVIQTAASQQAEVLKQLLLTKSFLIDVVTRTRLRQAYEAAPNRNRYLDQIAKRFRVETMGTSLVRVSFAWRDPESPAELVNAALVVRAERLSQARAASSAALGTLYQRQIELAESQVAEAQKALDDFNATHKPPLSESDQHRQAQLRLSADFAAVHVSELRSQLERAAIAPAVLEVSGLEFQVVDEPRVATEPGGGERPALMIAFVAMAAGVALAMLLTLVVTIVRGRRYVAEDTRAVPARPLAALGRQAPRDVETA
jgi:uncharacterized protein involved in exopolysaccharide biosynthesis